MESQYTTSDPVDNEFIDNPESRNYNQSSTEDRKDEVPSASVDIDGTMVIGNGSNAENCEQKERESSDNEQTKMSSSDSVESKSGKQASSREDSQVASNTEMENMTAIISTANTIDEIESIESGIDRQDTQEELDTERLVEAGTTMESNGNEVAAKLQSEPGKENSIGEEQVVTILEGNFASDERYSGADGKTILETNERTEKEEEPHHRVRFADKEDEIAGNNNE